MNYDPIHDTYAQLAAGLPSSQETNHTNDHTNSHGGNTGQEGHGVDEIDGADTVPTTVLSTFQDNDDDEDNEDNDTDKKSKSRRPVSASIPRGVRYLKKSDGEPFWRKDIQYDFLHALFENDQKVFTNYFSYCSVPGFNNGPLYSFSELYIRTLAESSKCSKVLKERLLRDVDMGKSVAKVCLLVNTGRMNTTINFVPEMRSTLRTYHSIPSLQADSTTGASKPLQDTPRLKSILKAVSDANENFQSLEQLLENPPAKKPNTNLVLLLFLLSNNYRGIKFYNSHSEDSTNAANPFMEFFLETKIQPANRAKRFLWLLYTYLETSFQPEELAANPFNPNVIPDIELVPENELQNFDKDTDYEIEYSERMFRTRLKYLADDEHLNNPKRGTKAKRDIHEDQETDEINGSDKRKKPNPSHIGYPEAESDVVDDFSANQTQFPLPLLETARELTTLEGKNEPDQSLSRTSRRTLMTKVLASLKNVKVDDKELIRGKMLLEDWIFKYFQFKKSQDGLLAIEWDDIKYDIEHGVEDHVYKHELELAHKRNDSGGAISEYEPQYEFDSYNEKTEYLYNLLSYAYHRLGSLYSKPPIPKRFSFNLEQGKIEYN